MEHTIIEAITLPDAWFQCVAKVLDGYRYIVTKGSYEGQERFEFDAISIQIKYPGARPLVPDMPPGVNLPPPATQQQVEDYLPYLMTGDIQPNETYTYGNRLVGKQKMCVVDHMCPSCDRKHYREWYTPDQIQTVIDTFREVGEGWNQATMEIAAPSDCGTDDPPCLRLIDCRLRYGKLHFFTYWRSWDLWSGFPVNLAALQIMKEYMAAEIGCDDGEIFAFSKGLHIYGYAEELAKIRLGKV